MTPENQRFSALSEIFRGSWLNTLAPLLMLLLTIAAERISLPDWMSTILFITIWFSGFGMLVRAQFARRKRNSDVFLSFGLSTLIGFSLVALVIAVLPKAGG